MKTKRWTKPKLVVLFKGRPEEAVLQACKWQGVSGPQQNPCRHGSRPCDTQTPS
jgi:hypothetical protein